MEVIKDKKIKVSVIVPVYNTEDYLYKCIDSLIHQTLEEIQIVIVNDGSTDNSQGIIDSYVKKYPDKMISLKQENRGQASARNNALKHVEGEYIGFLDSDDFVNPDMFEKMYNRAKLENSDFVSCGYKDVTYRNGEEIILQKYVGQKPCKEASGLFFGTVVSPFIHLYEKRIFDESGVKFPEGYIYEDTAFFLNLIPYIRKPIFIEESLANRLRREGSTTRLVNPRKIEQMLPVLLNSIEFYKTKGYYEQYCEELEYFCARILLCSSMKRVSMIGQKEEQAKLIDETLSFLYTQFPTYKNNVYINKGLRGVYMRSFNRYTGKLYLKIWACQEKRRKYD